MTVTPKAFISHATEDKAAFVVPFATKLRERGVDAWVDQWEIKAGESLVDRIFESGIKDASVFIVILSSTSAIKPWVRDEMDAGVMRRISGQAKVIPILLDDVEVPISLQHTLYLSVPNDGLEGVLEKTLHSIFEIDNRPPLGEPPAYTTAALLPKVLPDPVDNVVLNAIIDLHLDDSTGMIDDHTLLSCLAGTGVSAEAMNESVEIFESERRITRQKAVSGNWFITGVSSRTLLPALTARGVGVQGLQMRMLTEIVNKPQQTFLSFEDQPRVVTRALLESLEAQGFIKTQSAVSGHVFIVDVSAAATRTVRRA
ncbi:toll/interleukin-1 receptor domain-containing protein [Paenarthrobacter sp. TYUT067]|uniref:toll/interleukin-1 receptor domain-containing protein n=1 Tax=Paenarthrobacter sp. TYUT067 TaxID=2926245 RepID=UPI00202EF874|nr:toll/interleukin-1 receptor domain-containing protein [Paenarthrobacter sp. TYUT067]MCM0614431.1 toll/interleukin-1 receptor domain-containing protein [Paenarthrobacter sp. TYUT067]